MEKPTISVDSVGTITGWNAAAAELYGYPAADIIGQPLHMIYPLGPTAKEDHPLNFNHGRDDIDSIEALHKTRDGRFIVVDFSVRRNRPGDGDGFYTIGVERVSRGSGTDEQHPSPEAGQLWTLAVVETAVEGIVSIDEFGIVGYMNPAAEALFGYRRDEVTGKNVSMLMPSSYAREHDQYIANYLDTGVRKIIGIGRDVVGLRKNGTTFPMHLAVSEVWLGGRRMFTGIIHDTSHRRKAQEEKDRLLRELNRRNRELTCLYRLGEAARTIEHEGDMFQRAADLIHDAVALPAVTGTRIAFDGRAFCTEPFQETPWAVRSSIIADGRQRGQVEVFYLEEELSKETNFVLDNEQNLLDTVAELLGATIERREAEAKVIHASKLASVGELAAGVGHEINNPVNGIINCAQILMEHLDKTSKDFEFARLIHGEAERIAKIVQSLLMYSRQDKDQHSLADLTDIVGVVMSLCHKRLVKSHIELSVEVAEDLPRFRCRSEQLQQVLLNLVINATHALDERYPGPDPNKIMRITATQRKARGETFIRIVVEDHGCGIAPEHMDRIFDPFFTTKGRDTGTGLGLSVSHGIMKSHGGTIKAESKRGEYTRMILELPAKGPEHA